MDTINPADPLGSAQESYVRELFGITFRSSTWEQGGFHGNLHPSFFSPRSYYQVLETGLQFTEDTPQPAPVSVRSL